MRLISSTSASAIAILILGSGSTAFAQVPNEPPPLTYDEALANDAKKYAASYGVSVEEAKRRLVIMTSTAEEIDALEAELGDDVSGVYFDNGPEFALVARTVGKARSERKIRVQKRPENKDSTADNLDLKVKFQSGGVSRKAARLLIRGESNWLRKQLPTLQALSYEDKEW